MSDETPYTVESRIVSTTNTGELSRDLPTDAVFVATINNPNGQTALKLVGSEKELLRIAAGAVVTALNKARGV